MHLQQARAPAFQRSGGVWWSTSTLEAGAHGISQVLEKSGLYTMDLIEWVWEGAGASHLVAGIKGVLMLEP